VQTQNEAASLIKRFWHKLVGPAPEPEVIVPSAPVAEKVKSADESQSSRGRRRGGRNQGQKNQEPRPNRAPQEQDAKQEQGKEPRPNRNIRGPGRNVRRNLAPANATVDETIELVKSEVAAANEAPITEAALLTSEIPVPTDEQARQTARKSSSRRGPNRRRPRNPNYKKTEGEDDSNGGNAGGDGTTDIRGEDRTTQSRSYDSDFADRVERGERSEFQASATQEPQKPVIESSPKAVEE
jgi:ribonuclease E